jgi:hypothetical protein
MSETAARQARFLEEFDLRGMAIERGRLPSDLVEAAREWHSRFYPTASLEIPCIEEPILVMWRHRLGGAKRYVRLYDAPAIWKIASHPAILDPIKALCGGEVRLLESVIFDKPPGEGGALAWHQDNSFYPLSGGRQVSALVALDPMSSANGAPSYAVASHLGPVSGAVDLHTGNRLDGDQRDVPVDPVTLGYTVVTPDMALGDVIFFDAKTWHGSGANDSRSDQRRLVSLRYISLDTVHDPIPGNSATFVQQITSPVGQPLEGGAFPIMD